MRFSGLIVLLAAAMLMGCNAASKSSEVAVTSNNNTKAQPNTPPDNVRRVTVAELRDALEQGKAIVVDVRSEAQYKQEHIKGALNIPENQISSRAKELPKDKLIVLYCS